MRNIELLLDRYLARQTQYAINLIGPWGKGKTYYYRNVLQKRIAETSTPTDNNIKYKPVYISLFGLRTVDEIQVKIFNELLYQYFTRRNYWLLPSSPKKIKITSRLMKLVIKGFLTFKGWKNVNEFSASVSELAKDVIDTTQLLICFDDLERKSSELSIEDFTGYINTLVEENVKILIICNEDKISDDNYKFFKEKIIDTTYEYNPASSKVIDSIILNRYAGSPTFIDFLKSIKSLLQVIAEKNLYNYRHLIYSIDSLHDVYSILKERILDSKQDWSEECIKQIMNIAQFTLSISADFKASQLSYSDREAFMNSYSSKALKDVLDWSGSKQLLPAEESRFDIFLKKYYSDIKSYKHYNSIFDLVTGAKEFDFAIFETEFKKMHHLESGTVLPEYQVLKDLAYYDCFLLSDEDYKIKTFQMLDYAKKAKYKLNEYLTVYHYASRFDNMLNIPLEELINYLKSTMSDIGEDSQTLKDQPLAHFDFEHNTSDDEGLEKIRKHGLSIFLDYKHKNDEIEINNLIYYITKGLNTLYDKYHSGDDFKLKINTTPIFEMVDPDMLADSIIGADPLAIKFFGSLISDRYHQINYRKEAKTLYLLKLRLNKYLEENTQKSLVNWALKILCKNLIEIENKNDLPTFA